MEYSFSEFDTIRKMVIEHQVKLIKSGEIKAEDIVLNGVKPIDEMELNDVIELFEAEHGKDYFEAKQPKVTKAFIEEWSKEFHRQLELKG